MSIHQRIRDGRKRLGMTEQQFGDAVGVTRGTVQQWEKEGGTAPRRKNQQAVADILGISVAELMEQVGRASSIPPSGGFGTPVVTQSDPDALIVISSGISSQGALSATDSAGCFTASFHPPAGGFFSSIVSY